MTNHHPPLADGDIAAIRAAATSASLQRSMAASSWAVACLAVTAAGAHIAALNVYTELPAALQALSDLEAEAQPHERAVLVPVGPVTGDEMAAAGLITTREGA